MELFFATHQGRVTIGKWDLDAFNLSDGRRVLSKKTFREVLELSTNGGNTEALRKISNHPAIRGTALASAMSVFESPITFKSNRGKLTEGFEAEGLITLCKFILKAREANVLQSADLMRTARAAEGIIVSLANTGLIAMIDEATGFQAKRKKGSLQDIFDKFLRTDYEEWNKRFPDEFYQEIYRLRGWEWNGRSVNPPQCVGKFTNFIVYTRLAPGIMGELESRNPVLENGERLVKHHQWLSDDVGQPALSHHIFGVITLMKVSATWPAFIAKLVKAFPQYGDQAWLELEDLD
ncbi:MAG: P63C domain-containing protein [Acidobacteriaceae bacterium]|nr:P63C domain-containing protein [Acidobacteriaceae bacterium]